jgi:hypothetical protein
VFRCGSRSERGLVKIGHGVPFQKDSHTEAQSRRGTAFERGLLSVLIKTTNAIVMARQVRAIQLIKTPIQHGYVVMGWPGQDPAIRESSSLSEQRHLDGPHSAGHDTERVDGVSRCFGRQPKPSSSSPLLRVQILFLIGPKQKSPGGFPRELGSGAIRDVRQMYGRSGPLSTEIGRN